MATFLYKLGRFAFRRRHFVALFWVALLTLAGVAAAGAPAAGSTSFSIPGTEAQKAFDLLEQRFPGSSADGATARVVFKAPDGEKMTDTGNKATVEKTVKELADGSEVTSVADPKAGDTATITVTRPVGMWNRRTRSSRSCRPWGTCQAPQAVHLTVAPTTWTGFLTHASR